MKILSNLIINADDYGMSSTKTEGILFAAKRKLIHSTSVSVVNGISQEDVRRIVAFTPGLKLGLHVNLTEGISSQGLPYDNATSMLSLEHHMSDTFFKNEIKFQVEKFQELFGFVPTFMDSHQHFCYLSTAAFKAFLEVAREFEFPIRSPEPFLSTKGLQRFSQRVLKRYGLILPFEPSLRSEELSDILSNLSVQFRSPLVHLDLEEASQNNVVCELICHPEIMESRLNQDLLFLIAGDE